MFRYVSKYLPKKATKKATKNATKNANKETEVTTKETKVTVHDNGKTLRYLKSFENKFKQIKYILKNETRYSVQKVIETQSALAQHKKRMTKIIKKHPETEEAEQAQEKLTQIDNYYNKQKIKTPSPVKYQGVPLRL